MKTQKADVKKPSKFDELLSQFPPDDAGTGNTPEAKAAETPAPMTSQEEVPPIPKAEEAIPAPAPTAESTEEKDVETLKAELATAAKQIADLSTALSEATKALTDQNSETWKHKYEVLDGKIKKQGPEQAQRIKDLEGEVSRLTTELATAKTAKPTETAETEPLTDLDKELMDEMGMGEESYRKFVKRFGHAPASKEAAPSPVIKPETEESPDPSKEAHTESRIAPERAAFNALMNVKAPGWSAVLDKGEREAAFAKFINEKSITIAGRPVAYVSLLAQADGTDPETAAWVYNEFFKATAKPVEPKAPSREAADSRSKGGAAVPTAVTEAWTPERISKFNEDVSLGRIKRGTDEYNRLMKSYEEFRNKLAVS